jgi:hypothetical protein
MTSRFGMYWASLLAETADVRARAARAFKATLLIHAVNSLCAATLVVPVAASVPEHPLPESHAVGMLYTVVRVFDVLTGSPLRFAGIPAFVMLVVTPFLQVVWLRAQLQQAALHEHARSAANVYKQACLIYVLGAGYAALLASGAYLVARGCGLMLAFTHNVRLEQTFGFVLALPFALAALVHAPSLVDRAQLALAHGQTLNRALVVDIVRSVSVRVCSMRAGFVLATATLVLFSFVPRLWLGVSPSSSTVMFVTAQLAAAARTITRALWLAWLCEHVEAEASVPHASDLQPSDEGTVTTAQSRT